MPNLAKLYSDAVSVPEEKPKEEALDAAVISLRANWLNSTLTQEMFKEIIKAENELLDNAVKLACSSAPNNIAINNLLIRVNTYRNFREQFAKLK